MMCDARVRELATQLIAAIGLPIVCGSVTVNLNDSRVQSIETRTHQRLASLRVDKDDPDRQT